MKTIKLTAEEIRMLEIQMWANPCTAVCQLGHVPGLKKLDNGTYNCYTLKPNGKFVCPLQRAMQSIAEKLGIEL